MTLVESQLAALREIEEVWPGANAVVIGATALGFYFDMRWRKTADVDLAIALTLDELPELATRTGWIRHPKKEHEFVSPSGAKLDLLPAGPKLLEARRLEWRNGTVMSLAGMDLAFTRAERHLVHTQSVLVAPPPVIAILKMVSYSDRPMERERDLQDIAHLLDSYVDEGSERRWDEAVDCLDFDLQPAYLFGLDIARSIESAEHESIVNGFLRKLEQTESAAHLMLLSHGPRRWQTEDDALGRRVGAFRAGMQRGLASR